MPLSDDLERAAAAAEAFAAPGERVTGIVAAEPAGAGRVYLCAYESADAHAWLALDDGGRPVGDRRLVHEAASLAALCEVAEETAGGGDLAGLRARLTELRVTEAPAGIEAAEAAVHPNFPDADTVLIVELDGPGAEVRALFDVVVETCRRHGEIGRASCRERVFRTV